MAAQRWKHCIYICDSQLNRPESVSLASLARQLYIPLVLTPNAWTFGKWSPEEWNGIAFHEVLWSLLFAKTRQTRRPCVTSTDGC